MSTFLKRYCKPNVVIHVSGTDLHRGMNHFNND